MNTVTLNMYTFLSNTGAHQAEYVIHFRVAASQEYVNTYSNTNPRPFLSFHRYKTVLRA